MIAKHATVFATGVKPPKMFQSFFCVQNQRLTKVTKRYKVKKRTHINGD